MSLLSIYRMSYSSLVARKKVDAFLADTRDATALAFQVCMLHVTDVHVEVASVPPRPGGLCRAKI